MNIVHSRFSRERTTCQRALSRTSLVIGRADRIMPLPENDLVVRVITLIYPYLSIPMHIQLISQPQRLIYYLHKNGVHIPHQVPGVYLGPCQSSYPFVNKNGVPPFVYE